MPKPTAPPRSVGQARAQKECGGGRKRRVGCANEGPPVVPPPSTRVRQVAALLIDYGGLWRFSCRLSQRRSAALCH